MSRIFEALKRAEETKETFQPRLPQSTCNLPMAYPTASFNPAILLLDSGPRVISATHRYDQVPRVKWVRRDGGIRPAFALDGAE